MVSLKLREVRRSKLMTQAELAKKSGISPVTISRAEAGHSNPAFSTIKKLAAALEVDPQDLITDLG